MHCTLLHKFDNRHVVFWANEIKAELSNVRHGSVGISTLLAVISIDVALYGIRLLKPNYIVQWSTSLMSSHLQLQFI